MKLIYGLLLVFAAAIYFMLFGEPSYEEVEIARFPIDGTDRLSSDIGRVYAEFDPQVSYDQRGSLRIEADAPTFVELAEVYGEGEDLSFRQLYYEAKVKTEDAEGPVFLVMQAGIGPGMSVVGVENAVTGTSDWTTIHAAAGNPGATRHDGKTLLQIQMSGPGTVWVDDLRLVARRAL